MYYVMVGDDSHFLARGPKFEDPLGELEDIRIFDYDSIQKWPDDALRFEERRASVDPIRLSAVKAEIDRRKGEIMPPWFDDMDDMLTDLEMAIVENEDDDWNEDRKPILFPDRIDQETMDLIHKIADYERARYEYGKTDIPNDPEEIERRNKEFDDVQRLRALLMHTRLAGRIVDDFDAIEDMKMVAAHLLFLYTQDRQEAEQEKRPANEDFYYAGSNLYNYAVVEQMMDDEDGYNDYEDEDDDEDDYVRSILMNMDYVSDNDDDEWDVDYWEDDDEDEEDELDQDDDEDEEENL